MQNMISMNRGGKPVNAFFDVNWETNRVENINVRDGGGPVQLTSLDVTMLTQLIEDEVTVILTESMIDKAQGREVMA